MKKIFLFLAFLIFLAVSCSDSPNSSNPPSGQEVGDGQSSSSEQEDSSSSEEISSSSSSDEEETTPSSSSEEVSPSSSSSSISRASSSSVAISSSSSSARASSSSSARSSSSVAVSSSSSSSAKSSSSVAASSSSATKVSCVRSSSSRSNGTDYSNRKNWGVFTEPDKLTKEMDIFLLYPTTQAGNAAADCPYASIGNTSMRSEADQWYNSIVKNVVTANANPYMPYYRQSNVFGGCSSFGNMTGGVAMEDVIDAFEYYLENINKGERPFMLLGFSQGSSPLWELAENRLEQLVCGEANRKNHIVTYATGIPSRNTIATNKPVKFSQSYDDINVITSWNPYYESDTNCTANQLGVRAQSGPTTNPITWTTDENYHAMTENSKLTQKETLGARVHNRLGILLMKRTKEPSTPPGCASDGQMYMGLHGKDIYWFAESIKQNMADRLDAWKAKYK